ncbi:MAG: sensor histidine kinase [Dehalococcoidia bacterium]
MIRRARVRLTAWYAGIFVLMLLALGAAAYWALTRSLNEEVDRGVETVVDAWLATAPRSIADLRPLDLEREYEGGTADVFLLVFRADGALVANPSGLEAEEFVEEGLVSSALAGRSTWASFREHGDSFRVLAVPLIDEGRVAGAVIGGRSLEAHERQVRLLLTVLMAAGGGGLLMAVAGGWVVAGRALRPIGEAYERQRRFVGDASHELRSPLAVIRASSELLLREPLEERERESAQEILDTSVEATTLVEDLLAIARLSGPTKRDASVAVPAEVAADVVDHLGPLLEEHGTTVTIDGGARSIRFTPGDLRRALRALLENVLAHTPPGTAVEITLGDEGGNVVVAVRDHGPGVPETALDTLFDPFTRVDAARTPTGGHAGLGLTIARRLVEANGATIAVRNHPAGGLEFSIRGEAAR